MGHLEKTIHRKEIFKGSVFDVYFDNVRLENGKTAHRQFIDSRQAAVVVAFEPENGHLLLVRQYRYGAQKEMLELPAGTLDPGETNPASCAARELEEETGFRGSTFKLLNTLRSSPAYDSAQLYIYQAQGLEKGQQKLDPDEFLTVETLPLEQAVEMCLNGEITDGKTQVGILSYWIKARSNGHDQE